MTEWERFIDRLVEAAGEIAREGEEKPAFDGILADKEQVERAFGEVLRYESQGGYGE